MGGSPSSLPATLAVRAIASTSTSLAHPHSRRHSSQPQPPTLARFVATLDALLTAEQIRPPHAPRHAVGLFTSPPRGHAALGVQQGTRLVADWKAHPLYCPSFLLITRSARSCAAPILSRALYTAAAPQAHCTGGGQSKRRRRAEATHRLHYTTLSTSLTPYPVPFTSPHLPEAIGLSHIALNGPSRPGLYADSGTNCMYFGY